MYEKGSTINFGVNLIKISSTHLLPRFFWVQISSTHLLPRFFVWVQKNEGSKCVELILIRLLYDGGLIFFLFCVH